MNVDPCDKEREERNIAYDQLEAARNSSRIPPSHQQFTSNNDLIPTYIPPEDTELMKQAKDRIPELEKIYLQKQDVYNRCRKNHPIK